MPNSCLIDTNVLLRYLLDDNEQMGLIAEHIINSGAWTTPEVLAEVTYVLESVYAVERPRICAALEIILNHVETYPADIVLSAVREYKESGLDFVDCLIVAYSRAGNRVFTFDKGINKRLNSSS